MTEQVVVWRSGFAMEDKPDWWDAELERIWPTPLDQRGPGPNVAFGEPHFQSVEVYGLEGNRGWVVSFDDNLGAMMALVWCKDTANFMDLMTSRVPAWINLHHGLSLATSANHIRNAVISIARRGTEEPDVCKFDGAHPKDRM